MNIRIGRILDGNRDLCGQRREDVIGVGTGNRNLGRRIVVYVHPEITFVPIRSIRSIIRPYKHAVTLVLGQGNGALRGSSGDSGSVFRHVCGPNYGTWIGVSRHLEVVEQIFAFRIGAVVNVECGSQCRLFIIVVAISVVGTGVGRNARGNVGLD